MLLLLGALFACFRFAFFAYFETRARTLSSGVVVMFAMGVPSLAKLTAKHYHIGRLAESRD